MILPSHRGVLGALALLLFTVAATLFAPWAVYLFPGILFPLLAADLLALLISGRFSITARGGSAAIGREFRMEIEIRHRGPRLPGKNSVLVIRPELSGELELKSREMELKPDWDLLQEPDGTMSLTGTFIPRVRGEFRLEQIYWRFRGFLGLLELQRVAELDIGFVVLPELSEVKKFLRLERQLQRRSWGVGAGSFLAQNGEFDSLREYQQGDDATRIDWTSSTRLQQPMVKTYKPETSGWVTVVLDAGRWMNGMSGDLSHFDRALNSLVSLSGLVFGGGDYLRVLVTADSVLEDRVFSPRRSDRQSFSRFISSLKTREWDFNVSAALEELQRHRHKMTALIIISQFIDAGPDNSLSDHISRFVRRVPVLLVLLRDPILDERIARPVKRGGELVFAAASDLYARRQDDIRELKGNGSFILDIRPEQLTGAVISGFKSLRRGFVNRH